LPLSRLHDPDIRAEVLNRGLVASISGTTIWQSRLAAEDAAVVASKALGSRGSSAAAQKFWTMSAALTVRSVTEARRI
jgi:hypothetical protein